MRRRIGEQLEAPDIILEDLVVPIARPAVFDIGGFFKLEDEKAEEAEAAENANTDESKEVRS